MLRIFDFLLSAIGLVLLLPVLLLITLILLLSDGSPFFLQRRVGRNQKPFTLIKFRTMSKATESVATHLVNPASVTAMGAFLRRTKLDELPQLINVLKGEMSLVGPRPNLYNQEDLIRERERLGVYKVLPGVTGLSQLKSIDMSEPKRLAISDADMIKSLNLQMYFQIILSTALGKGMGDFVSKN